MRESLIDLLLSLKIVNCLKVKAFLIGYPTFYYTRNMLRLDFFWKYGIKRVKGFSLEDFGFIVD
jgi:hypothetical protein